MRAVVKKLILRSRKRIKRVVIDYSHDVGSLVLLERVAAEHSLADFGCGLRRLGDEIRYRLPPRIHQTVHLLSTRNHHLRQR